MINKSTSFISAVTYALLCILSITNKFFGQNDGWTWQYPKPQGNTLHKIVAFDRNTALAYAGFGIIIKTTDGGANWNFKHFFDNQDKLSRMFFLEKTRR